MPSPAGAAPRCRATRASNTSGSAVSMAGSVEVDAGHLADAALVQASDAVPSCVVPRNAVTAAQANLGGSPRVTAAVVAHRHVRLGHDAVPTPGCARSYEHVQSELACPGCGGPGQRDGVRGADSFSRSSSAVTGGTGWISRPEASRGTGAPLLMGV